MDDNNLRDIMDLKNIPDPDPVDKKRVLTLAKEEFEKNITNSENKIKGSDNSRRPKGSFLKNIHSLGDFIMNRTYLTSTAATACLFLIVLSYSYFNFSPIEEKVELFRPVKKESKGIIVAPIKIAGTSEIGINSSEAGQPAPLVAKSSRTGSGALAGSKPSPSISLNEADDLDLLTRGYGIAGTSAEQKAKPALSAMLSKAKPKGAVARRSSKKMRTPRFPVANQDQFESIIPSGIKVVKREPVSTFSIDVDTSSYAFSRRSLLRGDVPPQNSIRVEEFINYFDYDYKTPSDHKIPFSSTVAVYPTPWNSTTKLIHIGIKGYEIKKSIRPRANLVFLIDVSGSMEQSDKLPLLRDSFRMLVNSLDDEDRISMVVYAGAAGTVLPPTKVKNRDKILSALYQLRAGGSTAGGAGIKLAYQLAEKHFDREGINRVILATDGDFNVGIRDVETLKNFISNKRKSGVTLSVLGFGQGNYNDQLMQKLAQNGNGNASYIDSIFEAKKVLVEEANATFFVIAKDVKIQVEFNPEVVAEYRLIGYETRKLKREDFNNDKVDAGEIGAGHTVTAIYEITTVESRARLIDDLRYQKVTSPEEMRKKNPDLLGEEYAFLKIRYKLPKSDTSSLINSPILVKDEIKDFNSVPSEIRFATSVAAFAQGLRKEPAVSGLSYQDIHKIALGAKGEDPYGYRNEFLNLILAADKTN